MSWVTKDVSARAQWETVVRFIWGEEVHEARIVVLEAHVLFMALHWFNRFSRRGDFVVGKRVRPVWVRVETALSPADAPPRPANANEGQVAYGRAGGQRRFENIIPGGKRVRKVGG